MADLSERVKELECLYRVAAIFADRRESVAKCLQRVVSVLTAGCRFPDRAIAELTLDSIAVGWPKESSFFAESRICAPLQIAGRHRGQITLAYREPLPETATSVKADTCELFIAEEQALLDAVAHQVGVFVAGVEAEQHRREMEATLWHADRLATIGQLAAGVAHEINEPIGTMLGFAQLALKAPDLPIQIRTDLNHIVDAAMRGREIIRKLLLYSRQMPATKRATAINDVVEEAIFLLEAGCENAGIRFICKLETDLPDISADLVQIRQVITNLIINAIHAIDDSGTITVRTASSGKAIELTVSDTGSGMPPDVRRRAFDPFFTTKDIGQGTGLGLSIVQGIVAEHGGTIEVHSDPPNGSVFRLRLPVSGCFLHEASGESK